MGNLNEIIEDMMKKPPLGPDDKFRFYCTACGACCYDPEGITLSPGDIYRGAKFLEITPKEFVEKYTLMYVGGQSHMPILTLKTEGYYRKCVFLENNKCRIHKAKPGVCEIYPLGRAMTSKKDGEVEYRMTSVNCGKKCREYTVREWMSGTGLEKSNELFKAWTKGIMSITPLTGKLYELAGDKTTETVASVIAGILYIEYDTEKEFIPQLEENCKKTTDLLKELIEATEAAIKNWEEEYGSH